jgi:hypothetical protein
MPQHLFSNQIPNVTDANAVENEPGVTLGTLWRSDKEGLVRGVRFYLGNRNYDGATITVGVFDYSIGTLLAQKTHGITIADQIGFVIIPFDNPMLVKQNHRYITAVYYPCNTSPDGKAHYAYTGGFFNDALDNPPLHAPRTDPILNQRNGLYKYGAAFEYPTDSFNGGCYFSDVSFDYIARMPVLNQATGVYEHKIIKYRQGGQWHY